MIATSMLPSPALAVAGSATRMRTSRRIASSARNDVAAMLGMATAPSRRARISPLWPLLRAVARSSLTATREAWAKPTVACLPISCSPALENNAAAAGLASRISERFGVDRP